MHNPAVSAVGDAMLEENRLVSLVLFPSDAIHIQNIAILSDHLMRFEHSRKPAFIVAIVLDNFHEAAIEVRIGM